ncbi:uncharacterized protein LOC111138129 isoform X1 [Crassostrea virginica]
MVIPQLCIGLLLVLGIKTIAQSCPDPEEFYIKRGVNIYCKKIYNCKPGNQIVPCDSTCEEEKCVPCAAGLVQPFLIHSDNPNQCFQPELECNPRDTIPVRNGTYSPSCAMQKSCACNNSKCFYGNPCICERNFNPCEVGEEMNSRGDCVKCREGYQKLYKGCDQCERIVPTPPPPLSTQSNIGNAYTTKVTTKHSLVSTRPTDKPGEVSGKLPLSKSTLSPQNREKGDGENEEEGTTLIIVFVVIGLVLVIIIIAFILLYKCRYGQRRFIAKICREREAEEPEVMNGDAIALAEDNAEPVQQEVPTQISNACEIREPLIRMTSIPSDSGYEPHHPSLDSQISQTSHISVSTPVQATDGVDDLHPLLRATSQDHHPENSSSHLVYNDSSSPLSSPCGLPSISTLTMETPSTGGSMAVSEPEEINLDVKDNYLHQDDITRVMDSGHEECRVTLGRTATENEEDTLEKAKDTAAPDSLGMTKPHS